MDSRTKKLGALLAGKNSSKGTFSDKFKNKMSRAKEKLQSSNLLNSLLGKNNAKNGPTKSGGTFDINSEGGLFGGYRKSKKNLKDPKRSSIGPGSVKPLKIGDSTADILAKMYIFMEKTQEVIKKNYETEKKYRQEQLEEDERRHKKLIDELLKNQTKPVTKSPPGKKEENEPSWIDDMLKGMKKVLGGLLGIFTAPISGIFGLLKLVGGLVFGALGTIAGTILSVIAGNALTIVGLLTKPLLSLIGGSIVSVIRALFGSALGAAAATLLGVAYGAFKATQSKEDLQFGPEYNKLWETQLEKERPYASKAPQTMTDKERSDYAKMQKDHLNERNMVLEKYEKDVLTPKMKEMGFEPTGRLPNGAMEYKKGSETADLDVYTKALLKMDSIEAVLQKIMFGDIKPMNERLDDLEKELYGKIKTAVKEKVIPGVKSSLRDVYDNDIVPYYNKLKQEIPSFEDFQKKIVPEEFLEGTEIPSFGNLQKKIVPEEFLEGIELSSVNNIGAGPAKYESFMSASARNNNPTYRNSIVNGAVVV
jgi:hypothetical protein